MPAMSLFNCGSCCTPTVELHVHYKWRPEVFVYYLDGAILLMGPGRELLEAVAWNHTNSR